MHRPIAAFRHLPGVLLAALVFAVALPVGAKPPPPSVWQGAIDAFVAHDRQHPPPQHGVLFIGSSSIRFWTTLKQDFPGVPVVRRGFGGSAIADATHYAGRIVVPYHPRLIVMYAGDNDIAEGLTPATVVAHFKAFVARVHRDLPHTAIAFISIKPSLARFAMWPAMRKANLGIRDWAATRPDVRYIDIATPMLGTDGHPRPDLFRPDGLHMVRKGYRVWIRAVTPVLADYGFRARAPR